MKVNYTPYSLKLKREFKISYGSRTSQDSLIVSLSENGKSGYGESTAISYYNVTIDQMIAKLEEIKPLLESCEFKTPELLWEEISGKLLNGHSFLLSAIDCAAHDLYGKLQNKSFQELNNIKSDIKPLSNYTIGIGSDDEVISQIEEANWPVFKIKLSKESKPELLDLIRSKTDSKLRIDANAGWDLETAKKWIPSLERNEIELIEQPFAVDNLLDLDEFRKLCKIPVAADESCQKEEDVEFCAKHFDVINIKLMKCGGLTPALRMIKKANSLKIGKMAGCMTESTVGISAMTQLAGQLDYIDADGSALISNDPARGVKVNKGVIEFPIKSGLGINIIN